MTDSGEDITQNSDFSQEPVSPKPTVRRRRKRIRLRKRIRIKKKPSAKKKVRKIVERVFWALIVIGFIASLIVMIVQLDIKDEKFQQQKKKGSTSKTNSY